MSDNKQVLENFKVTVRRVHENAVGHFTKKDGFSGQSLKFFATTPTGLPMNVIVFDNPKRANATELANVIQTGMQLKVVANRCTCHYERDGEKVVTIPQVTAAWCEVLSTPDNVASDAVPAVGEVNFDGDDIEFGD